MTSYAGMSLGSTRILPERYDDVISFFSGDISHYPEDAAAIANALPFSGTRDDFRKPFAMTSTFSSTVGVAGPCLSVVPALAWVASIALGRNNQRNIDSAASRICRLLGLEEFMFTCSLRILLLLVPLLYISLASAQQNNPQTQPDQGKIYLDVVVTSKSGSPVTDLSKQDFTLLDNKVPESISSFKAVSSLQAPVEVILLVDAVNAGPETVAYERTQIEKFLSAKSGHLAHPTTFAVFTEVDTQIHPDFTTDGKALAAALNDATIRLRTLRQGHQRGECPEGSACPVEVGSVEVGTVEVSTERLQLSLNALQAVAVHEAARPGRKLVVWISPGWPEIPRQAWQFTSLQLQEMFRRMVSLSTQLRQARMTLYSIDPSATRGVDVRDFSYRAYLKGVSNAKDVEPGNLGLQVFAVNSGGLVLNTGNDLAELLQKCLADTEAYYEISFEAPAASRRDEYHHLEIRLAKPGLKARTRENYCAQLSAATNNTSISPASQAQSGENER